MSVSILSESAAFCRVTGLAITQISSIRWLVKVSYPIYQARLLCVTCLGAALVFLQFYLRLFGPVGHLLRNHLMNIV